MLKQIFQKIEKVASDLREQKRRKTTFASHPKLKSVYAIFKESPEGEWIIGKNDAVALYEMIRREAPQNILELGGGIGASTAIMALAAETGTITSVEQFQKCIDIARRLTPPELLKKISFVYSEAHAFKDDRISPYQYFSGYTTLPTEKGPFDFVIIDGPGYWVENKKLVKLPNGDIINLLPHLKTGCTVYIDGRKPAVNLYKRFLRPYLSLIKENKQFAMFERTPTKLDRTEDLQIQDWELATRRATTPYFS